MFYNTNVMFLVSLFFFHCKLSESVTGHYFMSHIPNICILLMGEDFTFWRFTDRVRRETVTFMSCAMIPCRSEAKCFPSFRFVLIRIVCADVWTNSIVDSRDCLLSKRSISIRISIFAKFNSF